MSFVEFGQCRSAEYRAYRPRRINETALAIGQLYLLMVALRSSERGPRAAKIPALLKDKGATVSTKPPGLTGVTFTLLNADLQPLPDVDDVSGRFSDGLWYDPPKNLKILVGNYNELSGVQTGYFRSYDDGIPDGPELFASSSRGIKELASV